jgi:hypothetical protein
MGGGMEMQQGRWIRGDRACTRKGPALLPRCPNNGRNIDKTLWQSKTEEGQKQHPWRWNLQFLTSCIGA